MADKAISDLTQALQITGEDLFVLQQNGEAKKLKGSQVVQYAKDSVAAEVQGVKEYADTAKASANAAAKNATRAESAAQGIDDKVAAADASAKAAASSAAAAAASATGVDEKVQAAQTAADNAAKSETAAKAAQTAAANAQKAAESAQTGAQTAKTAAESAQEAAESAKGAAAGSATAAGQKATQAAQSAEDAASAKSAAETAKTDAQEARDAIVNMIVEAVTLETGKPATVSKSLVDNVYKLVFGLPRGETGAQGPQGATGNGISGITLKSGNHSPGTSDVYTITLTDGTTFDFAVYNGANGAGAGDMLASVYDPQGKYQDVFKYVDDAIAGNKGTLVIELTSTFDEATSTTSYSSTPSPDEILAAYKAGQTLIVLYREYYYSLVYAEVDDESGFYSFNFNITNSGANLVSVDYARLSKSDTASSWQWESWSNTFEQRYMTAVNLHLVQNSENEYQILDELAEPVSFSDLVSKFRSQYILSLGFSDNDANGLLYIATAYNETSKELEFTAALTTGVDEILVSSSTITRNSYHFLDSNSASNTVPKAPGTASAGSETTYARGDHVHPKELPTVAASDNGKFLRVVDGAWAAASVPNANGVSF